MLLYMEAAGLILSDSLHYLDHLGPFCALKGFPLIICEPMLAQLASTYYPGLQIIHQEWPNIELPTTIISCHPRPILQSNFSLATLNTCLLPHGNSDKGWKSAVFEHLCHEQTVFVYGAKMFDAIQEKIKDLSHLHIEQVGNFRQCYFKQHQTFYRELTKKNIPRGQTTFLYAPTWQDLESNCSFWEAFPILAKTLPDDYMLLVKPHPNTLTAFAPQIEQMIGRWKEKPNIFWLTDFPPIYALLDICDGYIGDMSSIGYDFLNRSRPMYFLNHQQRSRSSDQGLYLYRCGIEIFPEDYKNLFLLDQQTRHLDQARFQQIRKEIYEYTFAAPYRGSAPNPR